MSAWEGHRGDHRERPAHPVHPQLAERRPTAVRHHDLLLVLVRNRWLAADHPLVQVLLRVHQVLLDLQGRLDLPGTE